MKKSVVILVLGALLFIIIIGSKTYGDMPPERIYCHCTLFGACKASGTGSLCAQSEPGGNIHCDDYNGNC